MKFFANLPIEIVNNILSYDNRFRIWNGIARSIIPKTDFRYQLLKKVCKFHEYYIGISGSSSKNAEKYFLGHPPLEDIRYLQDSMYVIRKEQKMSCEIYIEHVRCINGQKKYLYYSYIIDNYGQRRFSIRLRNKLKKS